MAVLKATVDFETKGFSKLLKEFPDMNGIFLRYVGAEARKHLKQQYLSGQEIDLRQFPRDKRGRYTITSNVNKKRTFTKIASYPVNLFERGRGLRGGGREAGKYIITRKLKSDVEGKMNTFARRYESDIMQGRIDKLGLG